MNSNLIPIVSKNFTGQVGLPPLLDSTNAPEEQARGRNRLKGLLKPLTTSREFNLPNSPYKPNIAFIDSLKERLRMFPEDTAIDHFPGSKLPGLNELYVGGIGYGQTSPGFRIENILLRTINGETLQYIGKSFERKTVDDTYISAHGRITETVIVRDLEHDYIGNRNDDDPTLVVFVESEGASGESKFEIFGLKKDSVFQIPPGIRHGYFGLRGPVTVDFMFDPPIGLSPLERNLPEANLMERLKGRDETIFDRSTLQRVIQECERIN